MNAPMFLKHHFLKAVSTVLLVSTLSLAGRDTAKSAVVVEYRADGTPNPVAQGWSKRQTTVYYTPGSETINGTTYSYVVSGSLIVNTGARSSSAWNTTVDSSAMTDPTGWTMTAVVRVVESTMTSIQGTYFRVFDDKNEFSVGLFNDPAQPKGEGVLFRNLNSGGNATTFQAQIKELDISSDYVTIQLYYDPSTDSATLYANGVALITQERSLLYSISAFGDQPPYVVEWGRNVSSGSAEAHWNEVRFETGFAVVPEPSAWALLGAGCLAIFRRKSRSSRHLV